MKLDILVPHYKEGISIIHYLLDSLSLQVGVKMDDFRVIIMEDGLDYCISTSFLNKYPYEIDYYHTKKIGLSGVRNELLKVATADYIMWCDCDDMFFSATGLWQIFREIEKEDFEILSSDFLEEVTNGTDYRYIRHKEDPIFMHGKVFKRQFLIDNDLKFNVGINRNEDSPFNMLAFAFCEDGKHRNIEQPYYLWKSRPDSTVRGCKNYNLESTQDLLNGCIISIRRLCETGHEAEAALMCHHMILQTYAEISHEYWYVEEEKENLLETERLIGSILYEFNDIIPRVDRFELNKKMKEMVIKEQSKQPGFTFDNIKGWLDFCYDTFKSKMA